MTGVRWPGRLAVLISGRGSNLPSIMDAIDRGEPNAFPHRADSPAARIPIEVHRLYPDAIRMILDGGWSIIGRREVRLMPQP